MGGSILPLKRRLDSTVCPSASGTANHTRLCSRFQFLPNMRFQASVDVVEHGGEHQRRHDTHGDVRGGELRQERRREVEEFQANQRVNDEPHAGAYAQGRPELRQGAHKVARSAAADGERPEAQQVGWN
ncbi:MAG: hypothetical protein ACR2GU_08095 [Rubrobacteraceae bacterium]